MNAVRENHPAALHWAIADESKKGTEILLEFGADPNIRFPSVCKQGRFREFKRSSTPLMMAAQKGSLELVELLLSAGADWSLQTDRGKTAVSLASRAGHTDVLKRLEQAGAKINYRSSPFFPQHLCRSQRTTAQSVF